MFTISSLYIYPVKSLGGVAVNNAKVCPRGLEHDRRWLLVDAGNRFLSQREVPEMALLNVAIENDGLLITHKYKPLSLHVPFAPATEIYCTVTIWNDTCRAVYVDSRADEWFTWVLGINCRLVYMPDDSLRPVDPRYAHNNEITSFADAYPFLLISEASLADLNSRLDEPVPMDRFRPNIVISGTGAYYEDIIKQFSINGITFTGAKLCDRCVMTTINQQNAQKNKQPLKTLAGYRAKGNKVLFGQNLLHSGSGTIHIGDKLTGISLHTDERFIVP